MFLFFVIPLLSKQTNPQVCLTSPFLENYRHSDVPPLGGLPSLNTKSSFFTRDHGQDALSTGQPTSKQGGCDLHLNTVYDEPGHCGRHLACTLFPIYHHNHVTWIPSSLHLKVRFSEVKCSPQGHPARDSRAGI